METTQKFKRDDFTITAKQLAKAQAVGSSCIGSWTINGAFPHLIRSESDKYVNRLFHKTCENMLSREIKANMKVGKFTEPIIRDVVLVENGKPKKRSKTSIKALRAEIERNKNAISGLRKDFAKFLKENPFVGKVEQGSLDLTIDN